MHPTSPGDGGADRRDDCGVDALVAPAVRGDRAAMRALLMAVAPVVARAARRVLGRSHADVDDVAQQALAALVQRLPSFRGDSSITHFAERIAVYRALSARRDSGARRRLTAEAALQEGQADSSPPADGTEPERAALLLAALDTLSPEQAEALTLHFLFDHTVKEIADMTGAPSETVRSRLRIGKQALRVKIRKDPHLAVLREGWE
jgi:RNA polymerase sigma-70 factor (ECF subfamily)